MRDQSWPLRVSEDRPVPLSVSGDGTLPLSAEDPGPVPVRLEGRTEMLANGDYSKLGHKPSIEGVTLEGDKSFRALGLDAITASDIDDIIYGEG